MSVSQVKAAQPYAPPTIEKEVKKQTNGWPGNGLGGASAALTAIAGRPWQTIALLAGLAVADSLLALHQSKQDSGLLLPRAVPGSPAHSPSVASSTPRNCS